MYKKKIVPNKQFRNHGSESSRIRRTSNRKSRSRSRSSSEESKSQEITDYKKEFLNFLCQYVNIKQIDEFWIFYGKYLTIQKARSSDDPKLDHNKLFDIEFSETSLQNRFPVTDCRGRRINFTNGHIKEFLLIVKIYQDYQQKIKFAKLKKIRISQNDLPIAQYKYQIMEKLNTSKVVLIAGNTGCGKSTQVPQYVMEAGYGKIVCTQPRRIACVSLAKRVAYETLSDFKSSIGYQIRFEKTKRRDTRMIFMTEGLLLRQASEEETLYSYDVIILDEVHERHLHGDFLIGILKCVLQKKTDLKLVLMSATINMDLFMNYFSEEHIQLIEIPGRLFPIEIHYQQIVKDPYEKKRDRIDCSPYLQILQMIDEKYSPSQKGDVLIFLNGFSEISTLAEAVADYSEIKKNWIVLPLHSSLSLEDQDKVFDYAPEGVRKCIISTNIAETSVTIDGIRFVIDSGKCNRMMYNTNIGVTKLSETNISQDSAKQRSGRAGRTGPGVCFRLYSEKDFNTFEAFSPAEIHLVPLESLILHMISLGLTDIDNFPFLEKPSHKAIEEGVEKLKFSGALNFSDEGLSLTPLGESLSQLPVDMSVGKMLMVSSVFGNVNAILALASLLSVQSPLTQNAYRDFDAEKLRKPLDSSHGDPVTLLNYYKEWLAVKQAAGPVQSSSRKKSINSRIWAKKRCLEEQRFYDVTKLLEQFRDILTQAHLLPKVEELSSSDRAIRYGELKHMKTLRRELQYEARNNVRKQLKYEMYNLGEDSIEEEPKLTLKDVEFRIANNFEKLQKLQQESGADTFKDLMLLKLIFTCGFYPQVAIGDEFNSSKTVSEKLFHTRNKNHVFLRPMSYFAKNPESLELGNDEIEVPPLGYFSKRPISKRHHILIYQSILEIKKVYLVNTMRMPCIQTLFLFGRTIATNRSFTQFVIDDFLSLDVPYINQGKELLLRASHLRRRWTEKLHAKLDNLLYQQNVNREDIFHFTEDLIEYMNTEVPHNIKRLLPADLKVVYSYSSENFEHLDRNKNPFDEKFQMAPNKLKGGINVSEYIIFDCLTQEEWALNIEVQLFQIGLICKHCNKVFFEKNIFNFMQHEEFCDRKLQKVKKEPFDVRSASTKPNSKPWRCEKCEEEFNLTAIEILKHRKYCNL